MAKAWNDFAINKRRIQKIQAGLTSLTEGQSHNDLVAVQDFLRHFNFLGIDRGLREGMMCTNTVTALRRFQTFYGLEGDQPGTLGPETVAAMLRPRCSMPDYPTSFRERIPWGKRQLRYAFGELEGIPKIASPDRDQFQAAVGNAFDTWKSADVGLTFDRVRPQESPDIIVDWTPAADADLDMRGGTLAHADFPPGGSIIVDKPPLPIHFDIVEHQWGVGALESTFDIETVALHEIGHCLGLMHTEVQGSVMYSFAATNHTLRVLQDDDLRGIRSLYSRAETHEKIALLAPNERYVRVEDEGSVRIVAYRQHIEKRARFSLIRLGGGRVALQSSDGSFVTVGGGGNLVANSDRIRESETFQMIEGAGVKHVVLVAHDGKLVRNVNSRIVADGERIDAATTFVLIYLDPNS